MFKPGLAYISGLLARWGPATGAGVSIEAAPADGENAPDKTAPTGIMLGLAAQFVYRRSGPRAGADVPLACWSDCPVIKIVHRDGDTSPEGG